MWEMIKRVPPGTYCRTVPYQVISQNFTHIPRRLYSISLYPCMYTYDKIRCVIMASAQYILGDNLWQTDSLDWLTRTIPTIEIQSSITRCVLASPPLQKLHMNLCRGYDRIHSIDWFIHSMHTCIDIVLYVNVLVLAEWDETKMRCADSTVLVANSCCKSLEIACH